jgi:hypothetical protein
MCFPFFCSFFGAAQRFSTLFAYCKHSPELFNLDLRARRADVRVVDQLVGAVNVAVG